MADILLFPSSRAITKPHPEADGEHVEPLRHSIARGVAHPDPETRARFTRVFGDRGSHTPAHAVRTGCAMRRSLISHEAWLCWFHLVHLVMSIGGLVLALLSSVSKVGKSRPARQTMDGCKLSTFKTETREQEGGA